MRAAVEPFVVEFGLTCRDIPQSTWNQFAKDCIALMRWEWFAAFEAAPEIFSSCGFRPNHLVVRNAQKQIIAIVPLYFKSGVEAEWAASGFLQQMAHPNTPILPERLVGLIPFSPVPGYQFLMHSDFASEKLIEFILQYLETQTLNRKTLLQFHHVERKGEFHNILLKRNRWLVEHSFTYRWFNRGFKEFDEFLADFPARRRNKMKRDLRYINEQSIEICTHRQSEVSIETMQFMFECYNANHQKHYHRDGALTWPFWEFIQKHMQDVLMIIEMRKNKQPLGMSLFIESDKAIFGRWWGSIIDLPGLHFSACYYYPIYYAIKHGKQYVDPGYQGKFKRWRGFTKCPTESFVFASDPNMEKFLRSALPVISILERNE